MNTITHSFLYISLLISTQIHPAYKAAKFSAIGIALASTGCAADLLRNYTKFPHPQLAKAATLKDLDNLQQEVILFLTRMEHTQLAKSLTHGAISAMQDCVETTEAAIKETDKATTSILNLELITTPATIAHLQIYPKKEDCPSIAKFDSCPAHKVNVPEGIIINATKVVKAQLK
jgi:hypothetical protein